MTYDISPGVDRSTELRERAIQRLKKKRDLRSHLLVYVLVNTFLVVIWAFTSGPDGFFWPVFVIGGWGIGVVANVYDVYFADDFGEEDIEREMHHLSRR